MIRIIIALITLQCMVQRVNAQLLSNFFDQQDTKDKTMMQQIALQETYLSEIKNGYNDAQKGLADAQELKNGSFTLNANYFNSLSQVSPAVANDPKVKLITSYQQQIVSSFGNEINWQQQQGILGGDEISYLQQVYAGIITACTKDIDELNLVVTPGKAQMKDAQRIAEIDKLYAATQDKYRFTVSFVSNAHSFALQRQENGQQSQVIKKLYNLN